MGFNFKKAVKSVAKVAAAPVTIATKATDSVLKKTNLDTTINKSLGIDLRNLNQQTRNVVTLNARTGSDEFKKAGFDAIKIGAAAAGGAGAITMTQAGGTALLASKIQSGQGASLGDFASLAGIPTAFNTDFGNFDFGNLDIFKPKSSSVNPASFFSDTPLPSSISGTNGEPPNIIMIGVLVVIIGLIIYLLFK